MKKILTILLCSVLVIFLTGCNNKDLELPYIGEEVTTEIATDKEIEISIKEGTLTNNGATLILTNNSDKTYMYGNPFFIQAKKDGKWHKINIELTFTLPAFYIKPGETKEIEESWDVYKLEKGTYRYIKPFSYEYEKDTYEYFNIAVEFSIY